MTRLKNALLMSLKLTNRVSRFESRVGYCHFNRRLLYRSHSNFGPFRILTLGKSPRFLSLDLPARDDGRSATSESISRPSVRPSSFTCLPLKMLRLLMSNKIMRATIKYGRSLDVKQKIITERIDGANQRHPFYCGTK